ERWLKDENFATGPAHFFDSAPALVRPLIAALIRRKVRKALWAQGTGRYTEDEVATLLQRAYGAISTALGDKPFLFGDVPCGADATL
ncbi:glutathione S-transferase C-terminal domain-containing protein, partial [Acinetobacter baumannii]